MTANNRRILSISELTRQIRAVLEDSFFDVWLTGEISNFRQPASGHYYFTLKDEKSQIKAVLFRNQASNLKFKPQDGQKVIAHGQISVYEPRGEHQIVLDTMEPAGLGALQLAFAQLKEKLEKEGLFDPARKRPLPEFPRKIGIITSKDGAAIHDILNIINRRFCNLHLILYPSLVQGEGAAAEICRGIEYFNTKMPVDVLIVGRGGGSLEDLWSFNEEILARAVYNSKIPVISAVGHGSGGTICDFVADLRAPTPSAAAELVVRDKEEVKKRLVDQEYQLITRIKNLLNNWRHQLTAQTRSAGFNQPQVMLRQRRQHLDDLSERVTLYLTRRQTEKQHRLQNLAQSLLTHNPRHQLQVIVSRYQRYNEKLNESLMQKITATRASFQSLVRQLGALSPLSTLERGYAICWKLPEGIVVRNAAEVQKDEQLRVKVSQGEIICRVEEIR